jgi:hypothetical protein
MRCRPQSRYAPTRRIAEVGASGFLGGKLADQDGVRAADESVQAEGFRS